MAKRIKSGDCLANGAVYRRPSENEMNDLSNQEMWSSKTMSCIVRVVYHILLVLNH